MNRLRAPAFALLAGFLLSALRAPLGLDLVRVPVVDALTSMLFRAAALLAVLLFVQRSRPVFAKGAAIAPLLFFATLGYAAHGLLVQSVWQPSTRVGFALLLIGGTLGLRLLAGRSGARPTEDTSHALDPRAGEAPGRLETVGLVGAGAGAAIALENVARHLRLFHVGAPEDDTVVGIVLGILLWVGTFAFGELFARPGKTRVLLTLGLAGGAAATWVGLRFLGSLEGDPLHAYLARFGQDFTRIGTWQPTALLSGAALVAPCFLIGAGLAGARHPARLRTLLGGAALGLFLLPWAVGLVTSPRVGTQILPSPDSWSIALVGIGATVGGGWLVLAGGAGTGARLVAGLALLGLLAGSLTSPRPAVWILSPWSRARVQPLLAIHAPEGILTVETERGRAPTLHLDRMRLSPTVDEEEGDGELLRVSWELLPPERVEAGACVLFVGQMTPARASVFRDLGPALIERTAPWHRHLEDVEALLFEGREGPPGEPVSPGEARRRIAAGSYDLVIVAPTHGPLLFPKSAMILPWGTPPAPVAGGWSVPEGTIAVVWLDAAAPISNRRLPPHVLLRADPTGSPAIGLVLAGSEEDLPAQAPPHLLPTGEPRPRQSSPAFLSTPPYPFRIDRQRRDLFARLRDAAEGTPYADLARGLELHLAAQTHSNPWESPAQQVEIDEDALRALQRAALELEPGRSLRSIWEGFAGLLADKRFPGLVLVYVEPLAERHAPWPALDRAVAAAYQEFGQPADAARSLERILEVNPYEIGTLMEAADQRSRSGDHEKALELARRVETIQPDRDDARRLLGEILLRKGDPAGRAILEELLEAHPDDEGLRELLGEAPASPPSSPPPPP